MKDYILECCVDSLTSAMSAKEGGANRLELCANLIIGGTTPSLFLFEQVRDLVGVKANILIRPRFGDFLYTSYEKEEMLKKIETFKKAGANGVVVGGLTADGDLDIPFLKDCLVAADGIEVTLHRAFDMCRDPHLALEEAKKLGISTILTSGQEKKATLGKELLKELVENKGNVSILVGGGIDKDAIKEIYLASNATAYHMSGKVVSQSQMKFRQPKVSMGLEGISEYELWQTSASAIKAAKEVLEKL